MASLSLSEALVYENVKCHSWKMYSGEGPWREPQGATSV